MELLDEDMGFSYPQEFNEIVNRGLIDFDPWIVLQGNELRLRFEGLRARYPSRKLVPFARRLDNDDVACWENDNKKVVVIHDFASPGWESRKEYDSFWSWFKQVIEDMIEFIEYV